MSVMEWTAVLGNVGEFVGAIGVVGSLVYLGIQVRLGREATEANTQAVESSRRLALVDTYLRRSSSVESAYRDVALSDSLSAILHKGTTEGADALDPLEVRRLSEWLWAQMHRLDAQHFQHQQGFLDPEAYENLRRAIARSAPVWKRFGIEGPRASFRSDVEAILSDPAHADVVHRARDQVSGSSGAEHAS
jgi:hypothetical protein